MSCHACNHVGESHQDDPFVPPGADNRARMFACSHCGARWHQYNYHYHLWRELPADGISLMITATDVVVMCATDAGPEYPD